MKTSSRTHTRSGNVVRHEVLVPSESVKLAGSLALPQEAAGVVVFAHGSGSSRHSPRNNFVAESLQEAGMATLLFDLLTEEEAAKRENVFDIEFLAGRLLDATCWLASREETRSMRIGYFGASTGAAAALTAAADADRTISAIVSRGGRPDLAMAVLDRIEAPTLLIVGEYDDVVVDLNRQAYERLQCEKDMRIVPKATHLFEEEGALEHVTEHARQWFGKYLQGG